MKMFSECSGECCVCSNSGFCLAGHGDDDFSPASKEKIIENLDEGKYSDYTEYMIKHLANKYGYIYDIKNVGRKKKEKQLTNEQPVEESFGGFTFKVVVAGNCVLCGKRIDDNSIFLCKDCQSKNKTQKGEIKK
jgi:hypothetical protein